MGGEKGSAEVGIAAFRRIQEEFRLCAAELDAGQGVEGADAEFVAAAREAFSGEPQSRLELDAQAAAYVLMALHAETRAEPLHRDFVRYWSATEGASFALRAVARAERIPGFRPWWGLDSDGVAWRALREAVLNEGEAARAELERLAGELRVGAGLETRVFLAYALGREDWGREDLEAVIASPGQHGVASWALPLALLAPTADEARRRIDRMWGGFDMLILNIGSIRHELAARFGPSLAPVLLSVGERTRKMNAESMRVLGEALALVVTPEVVGFFLKRLTAPGLRAIASRYLKTYPELSVAGLAGLAAGSGPTADAAKGVLREVMASRAERVANLKGSLAPTAREVVEAIEAECAPREEATVPELPRLLREPPWRREVDERLPARPEELPALPAFFNPAALCRPRLAGGGKALPLESVEVLGRVLASTRFEEPSPGLIELKEACDPRSLAAFAWDLFQAWLAWGAPPKESWAFQTLGLFGDDGCARRLTPLMRAWPGEMWGYHSYTGMDVLAGIGTEVALMRLHGIAQNAKFWELQVQARQRIERLAGARGLSVEELEDRLVPDLGLDAHGVRWLDFGPRRFQVVFDEDLAPAVVDEAGQRVADLPRPREGDDASRAKAALQLWQALKEDARVLARGQLLRLEQAMCAQRRWPLDDFRRFLLGHPLLVRLVRRLVWGAYGEQDGRLLGTFRVDEDSRLTDSGDGPFTLPPGAKVGVVHRLELDDALAIRWAQVLSDYELLQPFEQLSRRATAPTDEVRASRELDLVAGLQVPTGKVLGLKGRGWWLGPYGRMTSMARFFSYEKPVQGGLVVKLRLEPGFDQSSSRDAPRQTLGGVTLASERDEDGLTFGALSPIVYSELVRDLESLRS